MGNIISMPDQEYKAWVNLNSKILNEIIEKNRIDTYWLLKGKNKQYLIRYLGERGYKLNF